jgi:2-oxoglutarate dehydrogenase E1 component
MKTKFRKPLIVFTLRVCCVIQDAFLLLNSKTEVFKTIDDDAVNRCENFSFCTGKFYYELTAEREKNERRDVAIVRMSCSRYQ